MENKNYLDKILDHLVRNTKTDYEVTISDTIQTRSLFLSIPSPSYSHHFYHHIFSSYCKNQFGLTDDEIKYVWEQYIDVLKDK